MIFWQKSGGAMAPPAPLHRGVCMKSFPQNAQTRKITAKATNGERNIVEKRY